MWRPCSVIPRLAYGRISLRWPVRACVKATLLLARRLNKSPNLGNVSHKKEVIAETVRKCNGKLVIKLLATIVVALALVAKQWEKAHWNAGMCQYQHSHWALIRLRKPSALFKSCWMLCIFCSWSCDWACFQFVPSVRHQSAYCDTFTGIFRKCDCANAFWTRYLETAIGWRFRVVQKGPKWVIRRFFLIVPPNQWYGRMCQRLIFTVEPARWRRTCEAQLYKFKFELFYTLQGIELIPIFHHCSVVLTFDWVQ